MAVISTSSSAPRRFGWRSARCTSRSRPGSAAGSAMSTGASGGGLCLRCSLAGGWRAEVLAPLQKEAPAHQPRRVALSPPPCPSRARDRLTQSTRSRLSVSSEADILELQEVHERRDRLDNVGRWPLSQHCTKAACEGQCKKFCTVKMSVSPRRFRKKWSHRDAVEEWVVRECGQSRAVPAMQETHQSRKGR